MSSDTLLRAILVESVRAATDAADPSQASAVAEAIGRRVGETLAGCGPAGDDALWALGPHVDLPGLPGSIVEALRRGLASVVRTAPAETADAGKPAAPWAAASVEIYEFPAAARRAAHDLNQPLTVILGYAAILRRTGDEALRSEAVEQITKEARKMSEIIKGLSRLARGLDAA
jgi:signal transduction histidine kinase